MGLIVPTDVAVSTTQSVTSRMATVTKLGDTARRDIVPADTDVMGKLVTYTAHNVWQSSCCKAYPGGQAFFEKKIQGKIC